MFEEEEEKEVMTRVLSAGGRLGIEIVQKLCWQRLMMSTTGTAHRLGLVTTEESLAPGACLQLHVPFQVQVRPIHQVDSPVNKVVVKLVAESELSEDDLKQMFTWNTRGSSQNVVVDSTLTEKGIELCRLQNPFMCTVEAPFHTNMEINTAGLGSVSISDMESDSVSISTEKGGIHSKRLKCENIKFRSIDGDILCTGVMQGNIDIVTQGIGSVTGMRFQGNKIQVATENGSIDVSAIYAERSNFTTKTGNMNLENYHGHGTISVNNGNLVVFGLDGSLKVDVENGNADIQVSRLHSLHVMNKAGNIAVKVPESLQASLELEANNLKLEKRLRVQGAIIRKFDRQHLSGFLGAGKGPLVMLFAKNGDVELSIQDWLSSLQLGGVIPEFSHKGESHEPLPLGR